MSIDLNVLLALLEAQWASEVKWHSLGSRLYKAEHCHSFLLTSESSVCRDVLTGQQYDQYGVLDDNFPVGPVLCTEDSGEARHWLWRLPHERRRSDHFDAVDFAVHLPAELVVPWSAVQRAWWLTRASAFPTEVS